ncbi:MAG: alcohol dehydrogenase catalytic domain-containing protein [Deltaproteobacteria bacterium]|nr:alcohol dehydrogenase catalytic domain-containing protein [Deltaproteobacteria bacterium]
MKALLFSNQRRKDEPAPEHLPGLSHLQLTDVPVPDLPDENWAVIKSKIAGICGSDLGFLQGKPMPAAEPYFKLPIIPGHELFGEVAVLGKKVRGLQVGQRVSIDPTLGCRERGFKTLCPQCRSGNPGICEHLAEGRLSPGLLIGICRDTGGGWGEFFVAPSHRLFPVPDKISDDEASLLEPFSVCLRAVLNNPPQKKELVVVIGAGTIGLMNIAALKAVEPTCRIACVAKYPAQVELAHTLGAEHIIDSQNDDVMGRVGELAQTKVYKLSSGGAVLAGGVRLVYDTVTNTTTLNQSLRMARGKGSVVILGLAALPKEVDWTPIWMKEISVVGSLIYGVEMFKGKRADTFVRAIDFLARRRADLTPVRPRKYSLDHYREALLEAASKKTSGAVKVSFAF